MAATDSTLLELVGIGIPPYSARGLSQTLEPIEAAGNVVRAIDGSLLDLSYPPFQKYKSSISCADQTPPACDGIWPGKVVTVSCAAELSYPDGGAGPLRPAVPGSERLEAGFRFYRPVLTMRVMSFTVSTDEWTAAISWSMELEEG